MKKEDIDAISNIADMYCTPKDRFYIAYMTGAMRELDMLSEEHMFMAYDMARKSIYDHVRGSHQFSAGQFTPLVKSHI